MPTIKLTSKRPLKDVLLSSETLVLFWFFSLAAVAVAAAVAVDLYAQFLFAASLVVFLILARHQCEHGVLRIIYLGIIAFLSVRYLAWRTFDTLIYTGPLDFIATLLLYSAEVYAILLGMLGMFVCLQPIDRPIAPLPSDFSKFPSVDVFIPTYNESVEMLEVTVQAAMQMRYPKDRLKVYLLDDGGTQEKLNSPDPAQARTAQIRGLALKNLCTTNGAIYHTRVDNRDHKAGNVNAAFKDTSGELVVIFDADHVPTVDFLEKTVGHFFRDPKLFLVQTPHFFINPDPIEKNLEVFAKMPAEHEMFHRLMQKGLDYWNAALFAGSAAVLRREYLAEIGGFSVSTVTEDAETGLELHSRGYNSAFVGQPLISGLAPESLNAFMVQRVRWATGMLQILRLKNPGMNKGLSISQRLCYLTMCLYWLFPLPRIIFLLAPTLFLMFGMQIYHANVAEVIAYTLPHYWASLRLSDFLYKRVRWPFVSTLYEILQSFFALRAVVQVFSNPRAPIFNVTPKGTHLEKDLVSPLSAPFYVIFLILVIASAVGAYRYFVDPGDRWFILIVSFWNAINFLLILAALGALVEIRQRRAMPRVNATHEASLTVDDEQIACRITDVSTSGAGFYMVAKTAKLLRQGDIAKLKVNNIVLGRTSEVDVEICTLRRVNGSQRLGVRFVVEDVRQHSEIVALVRGDSGRWRNYWENRPGSVGNLYGLFMLVWWGVKHSRTHIEYVMESFRSVVRYTATALSSVFSAPSIRKEAAMNSPRKVL
jgi:cellulose synthase (UDP-forming)